MATDKVIIEYDVEISRLEAGLGKIEKSMNKTEKSSDKATAKQTQNTKKQAQELDKVNKKVSTLSSAFDRLASNLPFGGAIMQTKELASSMLSFGGNAEKAGTKAAGAMRLFGAAIKATGIGLLVAAIAGLISYFKRTDDGATQLAGIMRALTSIFFRLIDPITKLGEYIGDMIDGTKSLEDAFSDLGNIIQQNLINRFLAFSKIGSSLIKVFSDDWKEGLSDLANATTQLVTGIEDPLKKAVDLFKELSDEAKAAIDFEKRLDANADAFRNLGVEAAVANKQITQLFLQARNRGLEAQKRQELLVQALEKENAISDKTIALQKEKLQLTREGIALEAVVSDATLSSAEARKKLSADGLAFDEAVAQRRIQITDEQAQKIADAQKEIIATEEARIKFQEKALNVIAGLNEQQLNELVEKQTIASQQLIIEQEKLISDRVITEEDAQKAILQAQVNGSIETINEFKRLQEEQLQTAKNFFNRGLIDRQQYESQIITIKQSSDTRITQEEQKRLQAELQLLNIALKEKEQAYQESQKILIEQSKDEVLTLRELEQTRVEEAKGNAEQIEKIRKETTVSILNSEIEAIRRQREYAEQEGKETLEFEKQIREKELELRKAKIDKEIEAEKEKEEILKDLRQKGLDFAADTFSKILDASADNKRQEVEQQKQEDENLITNQLATLEKQRTARVISDEKYEQKKAQLEEKKKQKDKEFALKQFEFEKQLKLKQLAIETAFGIAKAIATNPPPSPIGLIGAAFVTAQAAVQAGLIQSQKAPKFEKGGIVGGKRHSQGGTLIEAEKGEFVMNRNATEKYRPLLEELNTNTWRNKTNLIPLLKRGQRSEASKKQLENLMLMNAIKSSTDLSHLERLTKSNKNVKVANSDEIAANIAKRMNSNSNYIK